ncbi:MULTISPECIES: hypothetical protein [Curtobacterium]|uniref:hypothetical protein n=1 Tax=Curtobacterium TaxID=2034 RepID=UPI00217E475C|nr:hypothetical protein [Curtobacterium flaccumfaciens]MCS6562917.1 hypothetical protein [Curtobacterium flaccumfaciens pv. poinsettiae]UXN29847.1 hypothetical protein N8D75_06095 [Curtobacterium flaccumfaciens]
MNDGTRAGDVLQAAVEGSRQNSLKRLARTTAALALAAMGGAGEDFLPSFDLVVRRRDDGAEVLRTRAGDADQAERLLETVERDLDEKDVTTFVSEWRVVER